MNKTDFINALANATGVTKKDVGLVVDSLAEVVGSALSKDNQVAILGFGTFKVSHRAQREGRNPRTGESITIAAAKLPKFSPGKALKDRLN